MKKSIIALSLATMFAAPAFANLNAPSLPGADLPSVDQPGNGLPGNPGNPLPDGDKPTTGPGIPEGTPNPDADKPVIDNPLPGVDADMNIPESSVDTTPDNNIPESNVDMTPDNNIGMVDVVKGMNEAGQKAYADIDGRVGELEVNFENFKAETDRKFKEMDQRLDATNASLHAVTNARPMVSNGQTAFGVGTGFAGSAQAIAVGVAHSFEDSGWSASATINQTTGGYSEFNGGAGLQYAW